MKAWIAPKNQVLDQDYKEAAPVFLLSGRTGKLPQRTYEVVNVPNNTIQREAV